MSSLWGSLRAPDRDMGGVKIMTGTLRAEAKAAQEYARALMRRAAQATDQGLVIAYHMAAAEHYARAATLRAKAGR